ncbi:PFL_4703 family integrating conjugative element protein [Zophobihabitans entericus]|uniref:TIGR03746 family integrating conjugative element protein n=1 Tax=Zophobihabitans entericus TaxID=1635327 RepID=A0A6G9IB65_9GAMM|nr:TIGR03746 family integrating conjugative element protein [Zophobihabitans entericus]QIQ21463.1 TIGR03746 family integrating conjugative element protein [Zophobihabitans entericus]
MSRFKNEIEHLKSHVKSLRIACFVIFVLAISMGIGWYKAPEQMTIHVPPDLRSGSMRKWWEVPPESVYAFSFYIFQQLNRWPTDGETDYQRNIHALSPYMTPQCQSFLEKDYAFKRDSGELRKRIRGVYEIPGRTYGDNPTERVKVINSDNWIVTLDLVADEYYASEQVKRAIVRYPLKVTRFDIDPERNPFGLALDCYDTPPERISLPDSASATPSSASSPFGG